MKYIVYATKDNGNGHISKMGEYEFIEDIRIRAGMFAKDVVVTIEMRDDE